LGHLGADAVRPSRGGFDQPLPGARTDGQERRLLTVTGLRCAGQGAGWAWRVVFVLNGRTARGGTLVPGHFRRPVTAHVGDDQFVAGEADPDPLVDQPARYGVAHPAHAD